jgi:hypothetical protein
MRGAFVWFQGPVYLVHRSFGGGIGEHISGKSNGGILAFIGLPWGQQAFIIESGNRSNLVQLYCVFTNDESRMTNPCLSSPDALR